MAESSATGVPMNSLLQALKSGRAKERLIALEHLARAARGGRDLGDGVKAVRLAVDRVKPNTVTGIETQFAAGEVLAANAAHSVGLAPLVELLSDKRMALREGAARALSRLSSSVLVPYAEFLSGLLDDDSGAVAYCALRGLGKLVAEGEALEPALPALRKQLRKSGYPMTGWLLGVSTFSSQDLSELAPSADAARVLAEYFVNRRDETGLVELARAAGYRVKPTVVAFLARELGGSDELRGAWVKRVSETLQRG